MAVAVANPRRSNSSKRNKLRASVIREETHCWLCVPPVDLRTARSTEHGGLVSTNTGAEVVSGWSHPHPRDPTQGHNRFEARGGAPAWVIQLTESETVIPCKPRPMPSGAVDTEGKDRSNIRRDPDTTAGSPTGTTRQPQRSPVLRHASALHRQSYCSPDILL